ncbi:MAG: hypothetical protein ACJ75B_17885 [Flavisolibacter sp.]
MILFLCFCVVLLLCIYSFVAISKHMEDYGGEIGDSFGLLICIVGTVFTLPFLYWSFKVFKERIPGKNYYSHLALIFLLGIVLPFLFFPKLFF